MTDKMVDVGGRRRPAWSTSAADIVGHQADVGRRHFFSSFPTLPPTSADVGLSVGECRRVSSADVGQAGRHSVRRRPPLVASIPAVEGRPMRCADVC